jgi:hypothetical protein
VHVRESEELEDMANIIGKSRKNIQQLGGGRGCIGEMRKLTE